jgi:SNF2 family DNA or RNA helicase
MSKTPEVVATLLDGAKPRIAWKYKNAGQEFHTLVDRGKLVTGARWTKGEQCWTAPATVDVCHQLRSQFGDYLEIKKPLAEWYRTHAVEREAAISKTSATDAELTLLPSVAPRLAATLRPDQRAGVRYVADGYRGGGIVADKPGLGKTLETIGGILEADVKGNVLVVCPKISVRNVWAYELSRWTDEAVYACQGTRASRERTLAAFLADPRERKWLIIVAEMLRVQRKPNETEVKANAKKRGRVEGYEYPELFQSPWAAVIADESHRLLGSLTVAKSNLMGEGLTALPLAANGRKYALSGTPFGRGGRAHGMFGTLHWLWPDEYTSFWKWAGRHFEIEDSFIARGKTAKKIVGLKAGTGETEFMNSLGPRILRRTKEEVLKNLPPKQYVEVQCEMSGEQLKQYKQLGLDAEVVVPGGVIFANGVLAEITRAKQMANGALKKVGDDVTFTGDSCKVDALMEKLRARGMGDPESNDDTKVIISSRFNEFLTGAVIPALEKEGIAYHLLTGKTSDRKRNEAMDSFQGEGGPRVFVLNSKAGGISINLDAADEVHCLDELDNPEDNEQLEDRAHRASRLHQVTILYYRTEGTYDTNLAASVEDKRKVQFEILDGRRGLADVRSWIKYQPNKEESAA